MTMQSQPTATFQMLIRKPAAEVFEALVNPRITSKFWFSSGSDRLEEGKTILWKWEQFGVQGEITVIEIRPEQLIRFRWPADDTGKTFRTVEISFEAKTKGTFVSVIESGFDADDYGVTEQVAGQTGGWALVLSALKAWLEHDIILKVVNDHHPMEN